MSTQPLSHTGPSRALPRVVARVGSVALLLGAALLAVWIDPSVSPVPVQAMPDRAASGQLDEALPAFPGAQRISVGRQMRVNGQEMNLDLGYVENGDPLAIVTHYQDAMQAAGLAPTVSHSEEGYRLSALASDGRQLAVDIHAMGEGWMILPVVSRGLLRVGSDAEAEASGLPLPKVHAALLSSSAIDGQKHSRSINFVSASTLQEIFSFYQQKLSAEGWSTRAPLKDRRLNQLQMQSFSRAGHHLQLSAHGLDEKGAGSLVYLLEEWTLAADADEVQL